MLDSRRVARALVVALPFALLVGACAATGGGDSGASSTPTTATNAPPSAAHTPAPVTVPPASAAPASAAPASAAPSPGASGPSLSVTSSVGDGPLTDPVEWIATVAGVPSNDFVDHVDFLIDGSVLWTEHNPPYQFNDDGNLLLPWLLASGTHDLGIEAVAASGQTAKTDSSVTTSSQAVPADLSGKAFSRVLSGGTCPSPGGSQCTTPKRLAEITFGGNGIISVANPGGSTNEGFKATPDGRLTLYGPAFWVHEPDWGFCDIAEGVAELTWAVEGSDLTIAGAQTDPCAARSSLFEGVWQAAP